MTRGRPCQLSTPSPCPPLSLAPHAVPQEEQAADDTQERDAESTQQRYEQHTTQAKAVGVGQAVAAVSKTGKGGEGGQGGDAQSTQQC